MSQTTIRKRYQLSTLGYGLGYLGATFGVSFMHDKVADSSAPALLLAAFPGIFIALMVRGLWRYIHEIDEVARHDHIQAMMSAILFILVICGGWGLVELFNDDLPRLPVFYIFPAFYLIYGLVSSVKYKRCA